MKERPINTPEARREARRKKRLRLRILRLSIVFALLLVLALVATLVVLRISGGNAARSKKPVSFLAVKSIVVEGETRYSGDAILEASGLYVGESLLAVNKVQAHDALLKQFPYLDQVDIENTAWDTLRIRVEETTVLGAVETGHGWMVVGTNNHALEAVTEENFPADVVRILGADLNGDAVGQADFMEERSLGICRRILTEANQVVLDGITAVDVTEKTNISFMWKNSLDVLLGNESALETQVEAFATILPTFLQNNGNNVAGRLDMSSYADDDSTNDRAIFTPVDILNEQKAKAEARENPTTTETGTTAAGETTTTAAA